VCVVRVRANQAAHFIAVYGTARSYQKFSSHLEGLFMRFRGNLLAFQYSVPWKEGLMAKQTTITVETDSLLILRGRSSSYGWCPRCEAEVQTIALEDTGATTSLGRPALEEWLNSEELHQLHAADGSAVTCVNSLLAHVQKTKTG
jgi:hypothetical protein